MPKRLGFIHDDRGNRSSKRLVAFVAMELIGLAVLTVLSGGPVVPDYMFTGLRDIVLFGLGAILGERFSTATPTPPSGLHPVQHQEVK